MKMCSRLASCGAGVFVVGAMVLASVGPAQAQQKDPFTSISFGAPIAAASGTSAAAEPQAGGAAAEPGYVTFFKNTEIGGLVDAYYAYWSTKQAPLFHAFDTKQNSFAPSMVEVYFLKPSTDDSRVGFKIKTIFGPAAKAINFNEPDTDLVNVLEGYVSYLAPIGKGLTFDVGKFVTPAGAEVIEAKDNYNYSRSLLFQNAIPLYHAGVRATYAVNDKVSLLGAVVNGWNDVTDNNTGKTVIGSITVKPTAALSIVENYIGGPENPGTNQNWRNVSDTVISYTASEQVSVLGNIDVLKVGTGGTDDTLWGVAGYVKYQATPMFAISPRVEYLDDKPGFSGAVQKIKSATITLETKPADNFLFRIEYRGDFSDVKPFVNDKGEVKGNQQGILFALLYSFSTK